MVLDLLDLLDLHLRTRSRTYHRVAYAHPVQVETLLDTTSKQASEIDQLKQQLAAMQATPDLAWHP